MLAQYNSTDENIVNGKIAEHANKSCVFIVSMTNLLYKKGQTGHGEVTDEAFFRNNKNIINK